MQVVQHIEALPDSPLDASAAFFADHLNASRALLEDADTKALAIVLPAAGTDHDDWRRSLARDLAREFSPKRVNVVGKGADDALDRALIYLGNAQGVTGQYCPLYE
jgi:hypothetical protein